METNYTSNLNNDAQLCDILRVEKQNQYLFSILLKMIINQNQQPVPVELDQALAQLEVENLFG